MTRAACLLSCSILLLFALTGSVSVQSATSLSGRWVKMEIKRHSWAALTRDVEEDINLGALQSGRYVLQVTVEDPSARKTVSQQTGF